MKIDRTLRDRRPPRKTPVKLTLEQRRDRVVRGAQWSASTEQWLGFLFDGINVTMFDGRTTRARALRDAHDHYDRIFHEQRAERRWSRTKEAP